MKHIIDLSEKYEVIDLFATITTFNVETYDLDPSSSLKDVKDRRLTLSVTSFHSQFDSHLFSIPFASSVCTF